MQEGFIQMANTTSSLSRLEPSSEVGERAREVEETLKGYQWGIKDYDNAEKWRFLKGL